MRSYRLEAYPQLNSWYLANRLTPPSATDHVGYLIWSICRAMCLDDEELLRHWSQSLRQFFSNPQTGYADFCEVENNLANVGLDFLALASEIAELAVRFDKGLDHYNLLSEIVQSCDVPVFRFLAAWIALNCGLLEECILHCEAVDEPFACIYTILGQAQLELGLAEDAIESLSIATELSPQEVIALFQLAKAFHVTEQYEAAWNAMEKVQEQLPGNPEVEAFFAMIALTEKSNEQRLSKAWDTMVASYDPDSVTSYQIGLMLDLAFTSNQPERMNYILEHAPWPALKSDKEFMANIPWILRKLESCGWQSFANPFLTLIAS